MAAVGLIGVREAEQPAATEPRVGALAVVGHDRAPAAGRRRACGSTSTGGGISGSPPGGNVDGSIWRMACRPSPAERIRQVAAAVDQGAHGFRRSTLSDALESGSGTSTRQAAPGRWRPERRPQSATDGNCRTAYHRRPGQRCLNATRFAGARCVRCRGATPPSGGRSTGGCASCPACSACTSSCS